MQDQVRDNGPIFQTRSNINMKDGGVVLVCDHGKRCWCVTMVNDDGVVLVCSMVKYAGV